jgi:hypothetical protein
MSDNYWNAPGESHSSEYIQRYRYDDDSYLQYRLACDARTILEQKIKETIVARIKNWRATGLFMARGVNNKLGKY